MWAVPHLLTHPPSRSKNSNIWPTAKAISPLRNHWISRGAKWWRSFFSRELKSHLSCGLSVNHSESCTWDWKRGGAGSLVRGGLRTPKPNGSVSRLLLSSEVTLGSRFVSSLSLCTLFNQALCASISTYSIFALFCSEILFLFDLALCLTDWRCQSSFTLNLCWDCSCWDPAGRALWPSLCVCLPSWWHRKWRPLRIYESLLLKPEFTVRSHLGHWNWLTHSKGSSNCSQKQRLCGLTGKTWAIILFPQSMIQGKPTSFSFLIYKVQMLDKNYFSGSKRTSMV